MEWKDLTNVLVKLAPTVATALGTPLAGAAVAALEGAFGLTTDGSTEDKQSALVAAISGANPDQLLAIKKADNDFAIQMKTLGFKNITDLEALAAGDRDSARKREISVKDSTPRNLAYAMTVGFFSIVAFMLLKSVPTESRDLLNILLGMLGTSFISVISYYFGSTASSKAKNDLLAKTSPNP